MKKLLFTLVVFMMASNSFALIVHFSSSCGRACTYTTDASGAALTQELMELNAEMCPKDGKVRIIYF